MVTIDFKSLESVENARGISYLFGICAVSAPPILALYITDLGLLKNSTLVALIIALAVGLLSTSLATLSSFLDSLRYGSLTADGKMSSGKSALGSGPVLSMIFQALALGLCGWLNWNFKTFILIAVLAPGAFAIDSSVRLGMRFKKIEKQANEAKQRLSEISGRRKAIAGELQRLSDELNAPVVDTKRIKERLEEVKLDVGRLDQDSILLDEHVSSVWKEIGFRDSPDTTA